MTRKILGRFARAIGYDSRNWIRIRQINAFEAYLGSHPGASVFEVSPGWNTYWKERSAVYAARDYPDFDICQERTIETYDIVIADQVLEHVANPEAACANMLAMLRPGGVLLISTPFLFRIHARPHDFTRWTEMGLMTMLERAGLSGANIETGSWGNKSAARAHIGGNVRPYGFWRPMRNDPEYAMMVWAVARQGD